MYVGMCVFKCIYIYIYIYIYVCVCVCVCVYVCMRGNGRIGLEKNKGKVVLSAEKVGIE